MLGPAQRRLDVPLGKAAPPGHEVISASLHLRGDDNLVQVHPLPQVVQHALVTEEERDVVSGRNVVDTQHLGGADVTEHGNLLHGGGKKGVFASAGNLQC